MIDAFIFDMDGTLVDNMYHHDLAWQATLKAFGLDLPLDEVIKKAAPDWPLDRIAAIDRSILRLGLTELLFSDRAQVPAKVAINESIE